jgi:hypothetical protein
MDRALSVFWSAAALSLGAGVLILALRAGAP